MRGVDRRASHREPEEDVAFDRALRAALRPDAVDEAAAPVVLARSRARRRAERTARRRASRWWWLPPVVAGVAVVVVVAWPAPVVVDGATLVRSYGEAMGALAGGLP